MSLTKDIIARGLEAAGAPQLKKAIEAPSFPPIKKHFSKQEMNKQPPAKVSVVAEFHSSVIDELSNGDYLFRDSRSLIALVRENKMRFITKPISARKPVDVIVKDGKFVNSETGIWMSEVDEIVVLLGIGRLAFKFIASFDPASKRNTIFVK